jgi:hypothetical protein
LSPPDASNRASEGAREEAVMIWVPFNLVAELVDRVLGFMVEHGIPAV